jgi:hypothetical protein
MSKQLDANIVMNRPEGMTDEPMPDMGVNEQGEDDGVRPNFDGLPAMEQLAEPIFGPDRNFSKEKIIKKVKAIEKFKNQEPAKSLLKKIVDVAGTMEHIRTMLKEQRYSSEAEKVELSFRLSKLAQEERLLEPKYKTMMFKKFQKFEEDYPGIYQLAISPTGVSMSDLNHALDAYETYKNGVMSHAAATNKGFEYMEQKHKLPKNFFTRKAE